MANAGVILVELNGSTGSVKLFYVDGYQHYLKEFSEELIIREGTDG